jgi:hypothetical protein
MVDSITTQNVTHALESYYTPVSFRVDPYNFQPNVHLPFFRTEFGSLQTTDEMDLFFVEPQKNEIGRRIWEVLDLEAPPGFVSIEREREGYRIASKGATPSEFMYILRDWLQLVKNITTTEPVQHWCSEEGRKCIPKVPLTSYKGLQQFLEWFTYVNLEPVRFETYTNDYYGGSPLEYGFQMFCDNRTTMFRGLRRNGSSQGGYTFRRIHDPFSAITLSRGKDAWDHRDVPLYRTSRKGVCFHKRHGSDMVSYRFVHYLQRYLLWYGIKCSKVVR